MSRFWILFIIKQRDIYRLIEEDIQGMKSSMVIKIVISLVCIVGIIALFTVGEKILPSDDSEYSAGQGNDEYADAFTFDPAELSYDGTGDLDLLEGVTLEGYSDQELKQLVFTRITAYGKNNLTGYLCISFYFCI